LKNKELILAHKQGLEAEELAIQHFVQRGYKLVQQRIKTPFAEVDALLQSAKGGWLMIEVKTLSQPEMIEVRLPAAQKNRLARAHQYLQQKHPDLEFLVVYVHQQKVQTFSFVDFL